MILWKLQLKPSYEAHWQLKIVEIYNHCHPALLYNTAPNFKKIQKFRFNVKICLLGRQTWSEGKKELKILSRLCALVRPTAPLCCGAVVMLLATTVLHCSTKVNKFKCCGEQYLLKFMFSKKATKNYEIFTFNLKLTTQIDGKDFFKFCGLLRKHEL